MRESVLERPVVAAPVRTRAAKVWISRVMSGLVALFLTFDSVIKLMKASFVLDAFQRLGLPLNLCIPSGIILLACTTAYAIPRTSILGAILLTGYLGGAVLTHLRAGDPLFSTTLFPVYMGVLVWGGSYLREERLRALIPFKSQGVAGE